MKNSRLIISIKRWVVVIFYSFAGSQLAERTSEIIHHIIGIVFGNMFLVGTNNATIFSAVVGSGALIQAIWWFRPTVRQFRNSLVYPPTLVAVPLGFIIFANFNADFTPINKHEVLLAWAPLALFCMSTLIISIRNTFHSRNKVESTRPTGTTSLVDWLNFQGPISDPLQDVIGVDAKVKQISNALRQARDGTGGRLKRKTIAIVGPYGVGKSSLISLTEIQLSTDRKSKIIFTNTSAWGFETSAKAQESILDECVKRLALEVDCSELRRLSSCYRNAVNETDGALKPLLILASGEIGPTAQLKRFTPILEILDAHLVVVLEDLDRTDPDFDVSQVMAMLQHLRHVERVSFILAIGQPTPIDLFKIVDEVVFLEPLLPDQSLALVDKVRSEALQAVGWVDPEKIRKNPWPNNQPSFRPHSLAGDQMTNDMSIYRMEAGPIHSWPSSLGALLSNTRTLKGTLRDFRNKWEALQGEVDPDELLILSSIRFATPAIYQYAFDHAVDLKHLFDLSAQDDERRKQQIESMRTMLTSRWERAADHTPRERDSAAALLTELFPGFSIVSGSEKGAHQRRIQSVSGEKGPHYLRIIHTGKPDIKVPAEGLALNLINGLMAGESSARDRVITTLLSDRALSETCFELEQQIQCLPQDVRLAIVSKILETVRLTHGKKAWHRSDELIPFDQWIVSNNSNSDEWYISEISRSLVDHPSLAAGLIHMSSHNPSGGNLGLQLRRILAERWGPLTAEEFGEQFIGARSQALKYTIIPILPRPPFRPTPDLSWLPNKILESMSRYPEPMLLEAAYLFQQTDESPALNSTAITTFFGTSEVQFYELLATSITPQVSDGIKQFAASQLQRIQNPTPV
jgi:hypothetical protein